MDPGDFAAAYAAALPVLQAAVETAADPQAATAVRLTAANDYAEALGELWSAAEARGPHLTELLATLDGLVSGLPQREHGADGAGVAALEVMALLEAHLGEPGDPEVITALIELTGADPFDPPLSADAAALWAACLDSAAEGPEATAPDDAPARAAMVATPDISLSETPANLPGAEDAAVVLTAIDLTVGEPLSADATVLLESDAAKPPPPAIDAATAVPETPGLGAEASELLGILAAAVEESRADLLRHLDALAQARRAADRTAAAAAAAEVLERFAEASAAAGFAGFASLCAGLGEQFQARNPRNPWPKSLLAELGELPRRLLDYLADPLAEAQRRALIATLAHPRWPAPLDTTGADALARALHDEPLALEPEAQAPRAAEVAAEDLALDPADDIDPGVFASFRREGPDLAQRLGSAIDLVLRGDTHGDAGGDALRQAQRYAHTLKGSANICGVRAVAVLGHHLEDLLEFLAERSLTPSPPLGAVLVAAADGLAAMFDAINGLEPHAPAEFRPLVQQVLDWANRIDERGADALDDEGPSAAWEPPAPAVDADSDPAWETTAGLAPPDPSAAPARTAEPPAAGPAQTEDTYLQVPARALDELLRLVGELSLALAQSEEQLRQAARTLGEATEVDTRNLREVAELEKLVDLRGLGGGRGGSGTDAAPARPLDPLELDQYDALHVAARRINEGVNDLFDLTRSLDGSLTALQELAQRKHALGLALRQLTMGTRLVPVSSIAARLQRTVRQTCRATGKEAELKIAGSEVRIDGEVLDRLVPALMHVVRNAIDHGIEPPETRRALGKAAAGELRLAFRQAGDQIEVTFADDGAGLDLARVRAKAIAAGLLDPDANPADQDLIQLTLRPGFSTRDHATQVSGRGVGMDVVADTIRRLNGSLGIESETRVGYRLRARFPSSLLTIHCLLIRWGDQPLALPAHEVRLAVLAGEGEVLNQVRGDTATHEFRHDSGPYPLVRLDEILGHSARAAPAGGGVVLIVPTESGERAVLVDALDDCRELVVKRLGALVPAVPGLLAASILGDGRVVPIIGLGGLIQAAGTGARTALQAAEFAPPPALPTILVVDDSVSMRRVLSQLVTDAGYRALTAPDGMAAIETLGREPVDLMLIDMEMPQMNGLELTIHLRARSDTRSLPIGMITSRSTERHRAEAAKAGVDRYFVKPYQDEAVLDFIQEALAGQSPFGADTRAGVGTGIGAGAPASGPQVGIHHQIGNR